MGVSAAFGIFFRLQVTDFDVFCLFLVLHFGYLSSVGLSIGCVVSVTPKGN